MSVIKRAFVSSGSIKGSETKRFTPLKLEEMKSILLMYMFGAALAIICPLCPVILGTAIQGGFFSSNPVLASSIAATATFPFLLAFIDGFRTRNMTFNFPNPGGNVVYHANHSYSLFMHSFGLASRLHLRTADLYLLDVNFQKVIKIASEKELHKVERSKWGIPQKGIGYLDFKIPSSIQTGFYYVKYVSGWTLWRHESGFEAISDVFVIAGMSDSTCEMHSCLSTLNSSSIIPPSSYTVENAPLELQFMFSHLKNAPQHLLNGVIDGVESIPRAIVNPSGHFIQQSQNISRNWKDTLESDPFKGTGQVIGVGLSLAIPSRIVSKKNSERNGKECSRRGICRDFLPKIKEVNEEITQTHVFQVVGTSCSACTDSIKNYLVSKGVSVKVSEVKDGNAFISVENTLLEAAQVVDLILNDVGFIAKHSKKWYLLYLFVFSYLCSFLNQIFDCSQSIKWFFHVTSGL